MRQFMPPLYKQKMNIRFTDRAFPLFGFTVELRQDWVTKDVERYSMRTRILSQRRVVRVPGDTSVSPTV
jgi:hypothetical protein